MITGPTAPGLSRAVRVFESKAGLDRARKPAQNRREFVARREQNHGRPEFFALPASGVALRSSHLEFFYVRLNPVHRLLELYQAGGETAARETFPGFPKCASGYNCNPHLF
jgi:hypothetical protein